MFIFVHIYKNAGTSITAALMPFAAGRAQRIAKGVLRRLGIFTLLDPQPFHTHARAQEMVAALGEELFERFFSFAVVRNPWAWQVSLYNYAMKKDDHFQHAKIKAMGGFEEYIRWRCREEVRYQKDFICDQDGRLLVDFVGRFENLENDFREICSRIGISTSLPRLNPSGGRPYREYYTDETRELVRRRFEEDIRFLGYEY